MWPREYAAQIAAMPSREDRQRALAEVPAHLRDLVQAHVEHLFRARAWAAKKARKQL